MKRSHDAMQEKNKPSVELNVDMRKNVVIVYHWSRRKALDNIKNNRITENFVQFCKDNESLAAGHDDTTRGVIYVAARPRDSAQYVLKSKGDDEKEQPVLLELSVPKGKTKLLPAANFKEENWYSIALNEGNIQEIDIREFTGSNLTPEQLKEEKEAVIACVKNAYENKHREAPVELIGQIEKIMSPKKMNRQEQTAALVKKTAQNTAMTFKQPRIPTNEPPSTPDEKEGRPMRRRRNS